MGDMYLKAAVTVDENGCYMSVCCAITCFVYKFCQVDQQLTLHMVKSASSAKLPVKLSSKQLRNPTRWLRCDEVPQLVENCDLPLIICREGTLTMLGMCPVLRHIVQTAQQLAESDSCLKDLLGLRQNCLRACSEVSEWTLYSETILPQLVERICNNPVTNDTVPPAELIQLENQLAQRPVEPSCRRKLKQKHRAFAPTAVGEENSITLEHLCILHKKDDFCGRLFVEGNNFQLTDLILFVCIHVLLSKTGTRQWCHLLPRTMSWYQRIIAIPNITETLHTSGLWQYHSITNNVIKGRLIHSAANSSSDASDTDTAAELREDKNQISGSSNACELNTDSSTKTAAENQHCIHHNQKTKFHASQGLVDAAIAKATVMGLLCNVLTVGNGRNLQLPWQQFPGWVLPFGVGGVPDKRATRKLEQLENVAAAVDELVKSGTSGNTENTVIVDFCSGGGHVGILLAYLFPSCKVILVENKEESVRRAVERVACSGAENVTVVQCNIVRFNAPFNIGVSLHACGVATDLVLSKCFTASASFVVAPCCYGAVRNGSSITYPRSEAFQAAGLDYCEYLALSHASDQTEALAKAGQGRTCMCLVDGDRCQLAKQLGYTTQLCVMSPPTCSPKNHILIGRPDHLT